MMESPNACHMPLLPVGIDVISKNACMHRFPLLAEKKPSDESVQVCQRQRLAVSL